MKLRLKQQGEYAPGRLPDLINLPALRPLHAARIRQRHTARRHGFKTGEQLPKDAGAATDAPRGNTATQASLYYEDHARLRMQARREGLVGKGAKVEGEDDLSKATDQYKAWRHDKITTYLADNVDTNATDHSTIMTNDLHAQWALAYDVAVGHCMISAQDMHRFREAADWRYLKDQASPFMAFDEHFRLGLLDEKLPHKWVHASGSEGNMPETIADQREHPAPNSPQRREHP